MVLTIDIGSSFLKAGIVDYTGIFLEMEKVFVPFSSDSGGFEVDPDFWIDGLKLLLSKMRRENLESVKSIVVSGNGPTVVPVNSRGQAIGYGYLWKDSRAAIYKDEIYSKLGEDIPYSFFLSKIYWIKQDMEEIYNQSSCFMSCPEYLSFVLTGNKYTLLSGEGYRKLYWNDDKIEKLGLDHDKFPPFISPMEVYGLCNNPIEGLKKGIPVICGGPDFTMSVLGSGSIEEGIICDRTGTSEGINFCSTIPVNDDELRTLPHLIEGLYTIAGFIPDSGELFLKKQFDQLLNKYSIIIKKIMENGLNIKEIRIIGGHVDNENLNRLKADTFPFPVRVYPSGADLIGNAVLGSVVTGIYSSIDEACRIMVKEKICYNIKK